nr:MAG TPA: hypothetical protein [Caudoviricetes sp.]
MHKSSYIFIMIIIKPFIICLNSCISSLFHIMIILLCIYYFCKI